MLNKLQRIIQEVNAADNLNEALQTVVKRVSEVINTESCSIYLYDRRHNVFQLLASIGFKAGSDGNVAIKQDEGLVGLVAKREEPINLENAQLHQHYQYFPETGEEQYQAFLGAPIIHRRKVLGVLVAQQIQPRRFDESEEALLVTVCAQLASVIAHAEWSGKYPYRIENNLDETFSGIASGPGVAIGEAFVIYPPADLDAVPIKKTNNISAELELFNTALERARSELENLVSKMVKHLPREEIAIYEAYKHILDETGVSGEIKEKIKQGFWAQSAVKKIINKHILAFNAMDDDYLRERVIDIKDIGRRLIKHLQEQVTTKIQYPDKCVLLGEEITPSQLAEAPKNKLVAIITLTGSNNSHVAILARALGVPVITSAEGIILDSIEAQEVIVDGYNGRGIISPSANIRAEYEKLIIEEKELYSGLHQLIDKPAITPDGHQIELNVNTGLIAETASVLESGAEGVGLYRTEIPFLLRDRFPSEEEQTYLYHQVLTALHPKWVTMRTLDIGGDKNLPYFQINEDNPFLGWRGIRVTLDHPEIFLLQVRAMLKASAGLNNLKIMLPMISDISEVREAKILIKQAADELTEEGVNFKYPHVGAMIETPSAVFQADVLAKELDFLSVGTNDLVQYLLAVDRNNTRVAYLYDMLHPCVLAALASVVKSAHLNNIKVAVCGEITNDPVAAILLLGMGFDALSMNPARLLPIKWVIRSISYAKAKTIFAEVSKFEHPDQIRSKIAAVIEEAGLGGLIRAGK